MKAAIDFLNLALNKRPDLAIFAFMFAAMLGYLIYDEREDRLSAERQSAESHATYKALLNMVSQVTQYHSERGAE